MTEHEHPTPSGADDPLAILWADTEAPSRDAAFELAVEQRIGWRSMAIDAAGLGVALIAGGAALWGFWPAADRIAGGLLNGFDAAGPVLVTVAAASVAALWLSRPAEAA